ncbi:chromosome partitioning protein ParB [Sphingobium sp. TA15]|uniref:ParB-like protein n=1 Tax=Sphingobium indicum (strain DSM 16413 / CCM 7287 / MTCC 6362 / UT26 / NBRC 101211 / UT26S) TaxID=452662 RepID=D4Z5Z0_SPHIU|nr:ParB/RepB/Spo0J family partition protein [Sphingobium indicum]BAI98022.1 ParB-like protein [Sphingobium indicum UT26S]BDD67402.1 chromosome partitioning protein ParB [Sphingobium sp. TA15]
MELKHIDIAHLSVSPANMRAKGKTPDLTNILPSVRARGVLVPLIVRQNGSPESYEIVAGKRRYHAALTIAQESGEAEALPCAIMEAGDDAAALEASLIENVARLDPDEVTRWESFTRLVREGRNVEDIALTFGLTELQVKRTLALGNLLPRIRNLYRNGEIDAATVRHLTLLSKVRQRDWLALLDDPAAYCPTGARLKAWACGGASIPVSVALFDLDSFPGSIVSDLFGEERYFADAQIFWTAQEVAIAERADAYREAGWQDVVILPVGEPFHSWDHERTPKRKGGKIFIAVGPRGDVTFHEGYLTTREARKQAAGETVTEKPVRPEIGPAIRNYVDLHRHAAVRAAVVGSPSLALRLMVAHAIVGSSLWRVSVEPQRAVNEAVAESIETSVSETAFDARRRAVLALLGFDPEASTITGGYEGDHGVAGLFVRLASLSDEAVQEVLAIVMAETLEAGSALADLLGLHLNIDMREAWSCDDALLDQLRDREVLDGILTEVAGEEVATANGRATGKVKRQIVRDCLTGENGRAKVEGWVPRWMAFPPTAYTERGGVPTVERSALLAELVATLAPQTSPLAQAA